MCKVTGNNSRNDQTIKFDGGQVLPSRFVGRRKWCNGNRRMYVNEKENVLIQTNLRLNKLTAKVS